MSNDTDPYSKWDAAQTLMMDVTLSMLTDSATVDECLLSGLRDVAINAELDPAFRALTLAQPARSDVMQRLYNAGNTPDPFAIHTLKPSRILWPRCCKTIWAQFTLKIRYAPPLPPPRNRQASGHWLI